MRSEKDFEWRVKPRCFMSPQDGQVHLEVLHARYAYCYEHLGDCPHPAYTPFLRYQLLALLSAFQLKHFPLVRGPTSPAPSPGCGKVGLVREVARALGLLLVVRSAGRHFDSTVVLQVSCWENNNRPLAAMEICSSVRGGRRLLWGLALPPRRRQASGGDNICHIALPGRPEGRPALSDS